MSTSSYRQTKEQSVTQAELGEVAGDNGKLANALAKMAERINDDSAGSYAAFEWLKWVRDGVYWAGGKLGKGVLWAFQRLSSYNERQANAYKMRQEGKAELVRAVADAELTKAKARKENATAREQEIRNETAEALLQRIIERGIDFMAEVRDGQLHVAVVKDESQLPAEGGEKAAEVTRQGTRQKKGASSKPTPTNDGDKITGGPSD